MSDELNDKLLNDALRASDARVRAATQELFLAKKENVSIALRYKRAALWIKADELRKQLAEVEAEAANIVLPKGD